MRGIREIRRIYDAYLAEAKKLADNQKVTEGLMGIGRGPGSDPAHDRFSETLDKALDSMTAESPSSQDAFEVLQFIYNAPLAYKNDKLVFWMLQGVHALTEALIGFLSPEDAAVLSVQYKEAYPKISRFPAQKRIAALLEARAENGEARQKRNLFDRISKYKK